MQEILKLRFLDRDKAFAEMLTSVINEMNARGMLHSGATIKRGHDVLINELVESRGTILETISENFIVTKPTKINAVVTEDAVEWLRNRKVFLEQYFLERMRVVVSNLQNSVMLEPFLNLSDVIELNEHELRIEIAQEIENYINSRGATLYDRIKNQFLDRPLVVIGVVSFAAVTAILSFLSLLNAC